MKISEVCTTQGCSWKKHNFSKPAKMAKQNANCTQENTSVMRCITHKCTFFAFITFQYTMIVKRRRVYANKVHVASTDVQSRWHGDPNRAQVWDRALTHSSAAADYSLCLFLSCRTQNDVHDNMFIVWQKCDLESLITWYTHHMIYKLPPQPLRVHAHGPKWEPIFVFVGSFYLISITVLLGQLIETGQQVLTKRYALSSDLSRILFLSPSAIYYKYVALRHFRRFEKVRSFLFQFKNLGDVHDTFTRCKVQCEEVYTAQISRFIWKSRFNHELSKICW